MVDIDFVGHEHEFLHIGEHVEHHVDGLSVEVRDMNQSEIVFFLQWFEWLHVSCRVGIDTV